MVVLRRLDKEKAAPRFWSVVLLLGLIGSLAPMSIGCRPSDGDSESSAPAEAPTAAPTNASAPTVVPAQKSQATSANQAESSKSNSKTTPATGTAAPSTESSEQTATADSSVTARAILDRMVRAYQKTPTYADNGQMRFSGTIIDPGGRQPLDVKAQMIMAFERPNRIRLHAMEGGIVCDGQKLREFVTQLPGQVVEVDAPKTATIGTLFGDPILADAIAQGPTQTFSWIPIQAILTLANDPLKTLLYQVTELKTLDPAEVEGQRCDRVEITRPDGKGVFWIDQKTSVLRRFEYPVESLRKFLAEGQVEDLALVVDFRSAQLGQPVDPNAFGFEMPTGATPTDRFVPPTLRLLGKPSPEFFLVGADNKPLTLKSLAGKVTVIEFWSASCVPCQTTLPALSRAADGFRDNEKVRFLAVNVDPESVSNDDLKERLKKMAVELPLYRDPKQLAQNALGVKLLPTNLILGPDGVVQDFEIGGNLSWIDAVPRIVESVLAGENVYEEQFRSFQVLQEEYAKLFDWMVRNDLYVSPQSVIHEIERSGVAQRSEPTRLRLTSLWKSKGIDAPGNLLPVSEPGGTPRILTIHADRHVAELDEQGRLVADHLLEIPPGQTVTMLRRGQDARGRTFYVGFAPAEPQVFVFDDQWKTTATFPATVDDPYLGVGDVQVADLDGDGATEIMIGYRGLVGVKAISPEGKPVWSNRSIANVLKIAVGTASPAGPPVLFCTNDQASVAMLDGKGDVTGKIDLGERLLYWLAAADLDGNGTSELGGLSAPTIGQNLAIGIDPEGGTRWQLELPPGTPGPMVDLVAHGKLFTDQPAYWILLGLDGSLHFVTPDGKPFDRFQYGQLIRGMAVGQLGNQPALLISTEQGVEAWAIK